MRLVLLLFTGAYAGAPRNLTMIGLRPAFMDPKDMGDKDWADAAGDLFFWLGDQMANRAYCKQNPKAMLCSCEVTCDDNVYSKVILELTQGDDSLNTVVSRNPFTNGYAPCNPKGDDKSYTYHCMGGDTTKVGQAEVTSRYSKPQCQKDYCVWKYNASKLVGGLWWSAPKGGDCDAPQADPATCTWRHAETVKNINASCANDLLEQAVMDRSSKACFAACPSGEDPAALECWNKCFFDTVFGTDGKAGMSRDELLAPFLKAFESDDPKDGGCPPRTLPAARSVESIVV